MERYTIFQEKKNIKNRANGDPWQKIVVIYNPSRKKVWVNLPENNTWTVVVNEDEAGITPVKTGTSVINGDKVELTPISMMVLHAD